MPRPLFVCFRSYPAHLRRLAPILAAGLALDVSGLAHAQQSPVMEFQEGATAGAASDAAVRPAPLPSLATSTMAAGKVMVKGFRFSGAHLIATETLSGELGAYVGRELAASELLQAAQIVANAYVRRGFMARVRVTSVSVADGIADMQITELRVGKLRTDIPSDTRIAPELAQRVLNADMVPGTPLPLARLENQVAMLNSQPGIAAAMALDPGAQADEVDVILRLHDRPLLSGRVAVDNYGLREVGQARLGLSLKANSALGITDQIGIDVEQTSGSELIAPSFSLPLGEDGARIGLEFAQAKYEAEMAGAALGLKGNFERWRGFLRHPLLRGPGFGLNADYALLSTSYDDKSIFGQLHKRRIQGVSANLTGMAIVDGTISQAGLELEHGHAGLSGNAADFALDALSTKIHGDYWRLRWQFGHDRPLGDGRLLLRAAGQLADRNLDPTRQFALGGPNKVRAYPTAEAMGDEGWLAGAEWRRPLSADLDSRLFIDTGGIAINAKPWTNQHNRYTLSGFGAGLSWHLPESFRFTIDAARKWGSNPGRNTDGSDSDGRSANWRFWAALSREF